MYIGTREKVVLLTLAALAALTYALVSRFGVDAHGSAYDVKVRAAETTLQAGLALRQVKSEDVILDQVADDPVQAAFIGLPSSPITTDSGSLRAKITSTNPNFAAVIVGLLHGAGVRRGDVVAIAYTGSFPALNVAAVAAVQALGAQPIITCSVGSSTWGANDPELTFLDIESLLVQKGILHDRCLAASVGGGFRRQPISTEGRQLAEAAIERNGVTLFASNSLPEQIERRLDLYVREAKGRRIAAFVNVGGGLPSTAAFSSQVEFSPGLTVGPARGDIEGAGLIYFMRQRGVPIVNLTDIVSLAREHRLPVAPSSTPDVGQGAPYRDWLRIRIVSALAATVLFLGLLVVRFLVFAPREEEVFDAYFGFISNRLVDRWVRRLRRVLGLDRPSLAVPAVGGEGSDDDAS